MRTKGIKVKMMEINILNECNYKVYEKDPIGKFKKFYKGNVIFLKRVREEICHLLRKKSPKLVEINGT